jgi:hypothetical protein
MSINIIVGSDEEDISKIKTTINILNFINKIITDDNVVIALHKFDIDKGTVDELIDWYSSMDHILTNPSFAVETV